MSKLRHFGSLSRNGRAESVLGPSNRTQLGGEKIGLGQKGAVRISATVCSREGRWCGGREEVWVEDKSSLQSEDFRWSKEQRRREWARCDTEAIKRKNGMRLAEEEGRSRKHVAALL